MSKNAVVTYDFLIRVLNLVEKLDTFSEEDSKRLFSAEDIISINKIEETLNEKYNRMQSRKDYLTRLAARNADKK